MAAAVWVIGAVTSCAVACLAVGSHIARKLTSPPALRAFTIRIHEVTAGTVTLDRTAQTQLQGEYSIMLPQGQIVPLGPITKVSDKTVERSIDPTAPAALRTETMCAWTGIMWASPAEAGLEMDTVQVQAEVGGLPGFLSRKDSTTWAVHVHGMGSSIAGTFRGVRIADRIGWRSLTISYRNTAEGPREGRSRSGLGDAETSDIAAAIAYARAHGAQRIVLFGWSMGALICLRLAMSSEHAGVIAGVICDSPVLRWPSVIAANLQHAGLPRLLARFTIPWLTTPLSRLIGMSRPVDLAALDLIRQAGDLRCPTLVLHGTSDWSAPLADAEMFAAASPAYVKVETFEAGHTMCWNSDVQRWERTVMDWASTRLTI